MTTEARQIGRKTPFARWGLLALLALRSLIAHRTKSLIVGTIVCLGTFLVVVGTALLDNIERSMSTSIISSLAGHFQVYAKNTRDELALFGGGFMGSDDIGRMDDFSRVHAALASIPNVEAVIPMGVDMATVTTPGELDRALGDLRTAVRSNAEDAIPALRAHIREIAEQMKLEFNKRAEISADPTKAKDDLAIIEKATSDAFWTDAERDPLVALEYLDTQLAPLTEAGRLLYFRYVGTDLDRFRMHFDRFAIVRGEDVPTKRRGLLFNQKYYDDWVKNYVARGIDRIHSGVTEEQKTIANDDRLAALVKQTSRQYKRITHQLDPDESREVLASLRTFLGRTDGTLADLVQEFLLFDDANEAKRYAFFYEVIAPKIDLYDVKVGDMVTLRAFTRGGFLKAVNVRLYGTFRFEGLEKSDLAGSHSIVDLMTFRELYGLMSPEKQGELAAIRDEIALRPVDAANPEKDLFGEAARADAAEGDGGGFDEFSGIDMTNERDRLLAAEAARFTDKDIDEGLALNAAVVLHDATKLRETMTLAESALAKAGLDLRVVDWQAAAGMVGQFIWVIRFVLYVAIGIIFTVALVIINNSMVMATMERVTEIGTMRAIGAPRGTILSMFLLETLVLGLLAGAAGAIAAVATIAVYGSRGIAASGDVMIFLFGGPRLYPSIAAWNVVVGFVVILAITLLSTLYPSAIAARIRPATAMRAKE